MRSARQHKPIVNISETHTAQCVLVYPAAGELCVSRIIKDAPVDNYEKNPWPNQNDNDHPKSDDAAAWRSATVNGWYRYHHSRSPVTKCSVSRTKTEHICISYIYTFLNVLSTYHTPPFEYGYSWLFYLYLQLNTSYESNTIPHSKPLSLSLHFVFISISTLSFQ